MEAVCSLLSFPVLWYSEGLAVERIWCCYIINSKHFDRWEYACVGTRWASGAQNLPGDGWMSFLLEHGRCFSLLFGVVGTVTLKSFLRFLSFFPPHLLLPSLLPPNSQRMSCSYLLCTILLFVAVLLAVTVTGTILFMNHYQAPPMSDGLPHISTNQDEANALVTVERGDGSRINIFIDPNCPDYNSNFLRLEGVQTSLLHSLTDHDSDLKSVKGQDRALLVSLAEEVAKLSAHAGQLKMDYESLRRGQGNLGQDLNTLQTEQGRLIQVRHGHRNTHLRW